MGAAAGATIIRGGGPVLTIGAHLAADPPTVSIARVTITGGVSRVGFAPGEDFAGVGGGIYVRRPRASLPVQRLSSTM